ncbi:MAG: hypothetical protein QNJ54_32660 [Prochloraceae cyanobacterium]|nr:hypothetical protein [Prochloraceae cyanobacterium]
MLKKSKILARHQKQKTLLVRSMVEVLLILVVLQVIAQLQQVRPISVCQVTLLLESRCDRGCEQQIFNC